MEDVSSKRVSDFLQKCVKLEDDGEPPSKEILEVQSLPLLSAPSYPQTVQEEISMVFNTCAVPANLGPCARRRREKGHDGTSTSLYVDRRKSKVWNYYTKLGDAYVECNVCKKQLSFHNSTTTMREHLVRKHSIRDTLLSQLKDDQVPEPDYVAQENAIKRFRQLTPENNNPYHAGVTCAEPRTDVILELVLEMIFRDLHPLSVVKDKGFGLLIGYLEPTFVLPSPVQLSSMLWHRYNVVKQHLEHYLQTAQSIVLCAEFWLSHPNQRYLTIVTNFIDGEWRRARCILETQQVHEKKAESNLGERLYAVLTDFGLSNKSVFCMMHDSLQGLEAHASQLKCVYGWTSLCCAAHLLHLCVKAGLEAEQVQEALTAARSIVRYFQQDAKATCSLNSKLEAINKTKLKLVTDTGARWITTIEMCECLLDLKWAVMSVLEEHPKGPSAVQNLADHQWKLLQDLVPVMRTLKIATSFLREEQNFSISSLMPCIHGIVTAIGQQSEEASDVIKTVVNNIRGELTQRWGILEESKLLESPAVIASFLDPRFKEMRFLSPGLRSELHKKVKAMLSQFFNPQTPPTNPFWVPNADYKAEGSESAGQLSAPKDRGSSGQPQSMYDILLGKDPTESMPEIHQQLENYIVEPLCKRSTNPLDWWKSNEHRFPSVARLARQYLAIPVTVVPPDQAFAVGESALEHRRGVLAPENLDQILFLHQNFDFLESMRNPNENLTKSGHSQY
ncbi:zinc finger BED domain-containing protein 1-like isoform X1 [Thamnophis elegans]|uniref:zinc finger BED domain-containing protein 1-like isoform X1 n=1 Tax=Thamnophis elegans TaxID=35005 RepID=UPI001376C2A2|nr:zinc finger BED domain-containing protein 1-like isoform X1 [Thamnophis elegans]XP_032084381.1 zinc finger BED domain-containing protein 1-like isoform X1 [Thamnophis elegans]